MFIFHISDKSIIKNYYFIFKKKKFIILLTITFLSHNTIILYVKRKSRKTYAI